MNLLVKFLISWTQASILSVYFYKVNFNDVFIFLEFLILKSVFV